MNVEKTILPTNGLVGYEREVTISAMKGRHLSAMLSSLDEGSIDSVIEDIIEPKIDINELTDEDKTFILHKSRVLTFGNLIKQTLKCPICGDVHEYEIHYDNFEITYLTEEDTQKTVEVEFDKKKYEITNQIPTGATWEEIEQYKRRFNPENSMAYILMQAALINTVNGKRWSMSEKVNFLADILPAKYLIELAKAFELNYGFNPTYVVECPNSGTAFTGGLAITADLFR